MAKPKKKARRSRAKKAAPRKTKARVLDLGDVDAELGDVDAELGKLATAVGADEPGGPNGSNGAELDPVAVANQLLQREQLARDNGAAVAPTPPAVEVVEAPPDGADPNEQRVSHIAGGAIAAGFDGAKAVAKNLDTTRDDLAQMWLLMLPDDWSEDEDVQALIARCDAPALTALLAIHAAQWRDGYQTAVNNHDDGIPFLMGPGGRPVVETTAAPPS